MTFTVMAFCPASRKLGIAQATGTPAIGNRCFRIYPGRGVLTVQAGHNYYLRELASGLFEAGYSAERILATLAAADPNFEQRQAAVLNVSGDIAVWTGPESFEWHGHRIGPTYAIAGNALASPRVVEAMAAAFEAAAEVGLEERLLRTIEAGRDAGGQPVGQRSAVLQVFGDKCYPIVDLRVDVNLEPIGELRKNYDWYRPLAGYFSDCYEAGVVAKYRTHLAFMDWPTSPPA